MEGKKLRLFKKMRFLWEALLNADKRQQVAKTIISIHDVYIARNACIYKALKLFADLQGPICYKDPQNKGINLIVY